MLFRSNFHLVDYVFNLACPASPVQYTKYAIDTMKACSDGLYKLLTYCQHYDVPMFHSYTSEVYGDPIESPQMEIHSGMVNSYGPRSCYDCGKQYAEALCYEFAKYGCKIHLGRIFNSYGTYMSADDGRVVSEFINKALKGEDLIIYGDGNTTRSFCYVDDLISGVTSLMKLSRNPETPINLGNPSETDMNSLANLIITMSGSSSTIEFQELPSDDPQQRKPNIHKAETILGWHPQTSLEVGLKNTLGYFREILT